MKNLFESWRQYVIEQEQKYVILIPGGFKPPHRGHVFLINEYATHPDVEEVVVFVGSSVRMSDDKSVTTCLSSVVCSIVLNVSCGLRPSG